MLTTSAGRRVLLPLLPLLVRLRIAKLGGPCTRTNLFWCTHIRIALGLPT